MIIKLIVPVLLALCGAGLASPAQAADYFCRVYSGTDTWEKSTVNQGHYKASGATVAQAEAAALATGKRNKPNANLTRARCETSIAAFDSAVPAPAPAPVPAPSPSSSTGAGKTYYCNIYQNGNEFVKPAAGHDAGQNIWKIELDTTPMDLEDKAMAFAKSFKNPNVDSAICESSIKILLGIDEE